MHNILNGAGALRGLASDGRNIDPGLGTLSGEGSAQQSGATRPDEKGVSRHVYQGPSAQDSPADPTYYDRPLIKQSVWSWSVPLYYYVGGTAGGSAVLGAAVTLFGRDQFPRLIVRTRWIAALGGLTSGALLVYDLGRPSRFLHMLRVFRPTSPMNVGSWILTLLFRDGGSVRGRHAGRRHARRDRRYRRARIRLIRALAFRVYGRARGANRCPGLAAAPSYAAPVIPCLGRLERLFDAELF